MSSRRVALLFALCPQILAGACVPLPSTVPDADAVIADLAPKFLRCYDDELAAAPTMEGIVQLEAQVDARGRVADVGVIGGGSLSATVLACLEQHLRSAQFSPPDEAPAVVVVPMTFAPVAQ